MTTKKGLIIAVLATFCLTATLFTIIPTNSSATKIYDPWSDYNDDGKIDIKDLVNTISLFQTYGDSTKNVNVTNWPTQQAEPPWKVVQAYQCLHQYINMSWDPHGGGDGSDWIFCGGYSRMYVYVRVINITHSSSEDRTTFVLACINWAIIEPPAPWGQKSALQSEYFYFTPTWEVYGPFPPSPINYTVQGIIGSEWQDYTNLNARPQGIEVKAPWALLSFFVTNSTVPEGWALLDVNIYFRNE